MTVFRKVGFDSIMMMRIKLPYTHRAGHGCVQSHLHGFDHNIGGINRVVVDHLNPFGQKARLPAKDKFMGSGVIGACRLCDKFHAAEWQIQNV